MPGSSSGHHEVRSSIPRSDKVIVFLHQEFLFTATLPFYVVGGVRLAPYKTNWVNEIILCLTLRIDGDMWVFIM